MKTAPGPRSAIRCSKVGTPDVVDYCTVRLGRLHFGLAIVPLLFALSVCAFAQADPNLVQRLEGQSVAQGQPDWDVLHKSIIASYPNCRPFTAASGAYHVWHIRSEDLVFQATSPSSPDGYSTAGFYWFDLHGTPLGGTAFYTGHRLLYRGCSLISVPGVSDYVVETAMRGQLAGPMVMDFGLYAYSPVLIRYATPDGNLVQNPYDAPNFACGPLPPPYARSDLLDALSGSNPLLQLQALTWLAGSHSVLTADILNTYHERVADSIRFWSLANDTAVSQAASALSSSQCEWIARTAKFFVSVSKPQPVPSLTLTPRLKDLVSHDIRIGRGGDFDKKDRAVKFGDRVVVEYEIKLATGATAWSNLNSTETPPIFVAGTSQVIDGLSNGVIGMQVDGVRRLEIPARLAFGDAGADFVPPGADLFVTAKLLHIATEPPFGSGSEKVLRIKEILPGRGAPVRLGASVSVNCRVFRLDGTEMTIQGFTGLQHLVLSTGSTLKNAILGMKSGGLRRLLVNFPAEFGLQDWSHYGAQIVEIHLNSVDSRR